MSLSAFDVTTEIELELTNRCNAACVACPRDDMPAAGLMTRRTLDRILELYDTAETAGGDQTWIARRVTLAGGGDPLINPRAAELVAAIVDRGFAVHLITNATGATAARVDDLLEAGVSSIAVSFWGIAADEYERSMQLPFASTLRKVEHLAGRAAEQQVPLSITWVRVPTLHSSPEQIHAFWAERGITVNVNDNEMWNRGGLLADAPTEANDHLLFPDTARDVWCADLALSDAWTWNGTCIMCCCNYFTSSRRILGSVADSHAAIKRRKRTLLATRPIPEMCAACLQPRRNQASWLAEPIRSRLNAEEWDSVTYSPTF